MNNNPLLGQVLGGLFGQAMSRRGIGTQSGTGAAAGGLGGGLGAGLGAIALGSVLGGALRGQRGPVATPGGNRPYANRTALLVMLLPLAMRWVQRNGGMNAVLDKFRQRGLGSQAQSWVSTGANQPVDGQAVEQVVGSDELRQMAQRLGVPETEVARAFAEIMPDMVDKLTPAGQLSQHADAVLEDGRQQLEKEIEDVRLHETTPS